MHIMFMISSGLFDVPSGLSNGSARSMERMALLSRESKHHPLTPILASSIRLGGSPTTKIVLSQYFASASSQHTPKAFI